MAIKIQTRDFDNLVLSPIFLDWVYNGYDSAVTHQLCSVLRPQLEVGTSKKVYDFEIEMLGPAACMTLRGIKVDLEKREQNRADLTARIASLTAKFNRLVEAWGWTEVLNYRSTKQLQFFFYKTLQIPEIIKREKGKEKVSLDDAALNKIINTYPRAEIFAKMVLELRNLEKQLDVMSVTLENGRWHSSFNVTGTITGRFSSNKSPWGVGANLQNIDKKLRDIFIPDEGYILFYADLQAAESRAVAYISGDENYISACESGDIHTAVCRMVWPEYGWTGDLDKDKHIAKSTLWLGKPLRDIAKMFGHATNYMGSAFTMAKSSGVPRDQVEVFQAKYFAAFPKIKEWHLNVQTQLQIHGFIVNPFGRIRHFWKRHNDDATLREAVAYGPQSVVADVMNNGIIQLHKSDAPAEILAQIHDACLGQVPKALYSQELEARILKLLEYPLEVGGRKMVIPLDAAFGDNWKQISL